jgi:hypothetical protein
MGHPGGIAARGPARFLGSPRLPQSGRSLDGGALRAAPVSGSARPPPPPPPRTSPRSGAPSGCYSG